MDKQRSTASRKSAIPRPKPKVTPKETSSSTRVESQAEDAPSTGNVGIIATTPSYQQFVAGLSAFDNDNLESEPPGDMSDETTDEIRHESSPLTSVEGESGNIEISTDSSSFAGFLALVADQEEESFDMTIVEPLPRGILIPTLDEQYRSPEESPDQSKPEKRPNKGTGSSAAMGQKSCSSVYPALEVESNANTTIACSLMQGTVTPPGMANGAVMTVNCSSTEPPGFLPVNLKRLSQGELASLFISNDVTRSPIEVDTQIKMFPIQPRKTSFIGSIAIRNNTSSILTFQIRPDTQNKYDVNPETGAVPIGGSSEIYVETHMKSPLKFQDIKADRFWVHLIPLARSITKTESLNIDAFWQSGVSPQWRIPVDVVEGVCSNTGLTEDCRHQKQPNGSGNGLVKLVASSDDLRCLEKQIGKPVQGVMKGQVDDLKVPDQVPSYGVLFSAAFFLVLLFGFIASILLH